MKYLTWLGIIYTSLHNTPLPSPKCPSLPREVLGIHTLIWWRIYRFCQDLPIMLGRVTIPPNCKEYTQNLILLLYNFQCVQYNVMEPKDKHTGACLPFFSHYFVFCINFLVYTPTKLPYKCSAKAAHHGQRHNYSMLMRIILQRNCVR